MDDIMFGEEDAKYIKRKKKNKKVKKASHKHKYDSYIMLQSKRKITLKTNFTLKTNSLDYALVNYCSECGRIKNLKYFLDEETIHKFKKRKKVMIVNSINDYLFVKYIPIARKNDN